jgi:hypothetical protein
MQSDARLGSCGDRPLKPTSPGLAVPRRPAGELGLMQPADAPESDSAARVTAPARSQAAWRVVAVRPEINKSLVVQFVDGTTGRVELAGFLAGRAIEGTVFEALRDERVFSQAIVLDGAVRWPNGADLAPDSMYDAIRSGVAGRSADAPVAGEVGPREVPGRGLPHRAAASGRPSFRTGCRACRGRRRPIGRTDPPRPWRHVADRPPRRVQGPDSGRLSFWTIAAVRAGG